MPLSWPRLELLTIARCESYLIQQFHVIVPFRPYPIVIFGFEPFPMSAPRYISNGKRSRITLPAYEMLVVKNKVIENFIDQYCYQMVQYRLMA